MKTKTRFDRSRMAQRSAFTLIEIMIVITIIAALMALTAGAVLKYLEVQQRANTQSSLDRVQSQLVRAWSKVKYEAYYKSQMTETVPGVGMPVSQWIQTNLAQIGPSDPNAKERTRVIYVKLKLRQAFPMSFNEAINPFPLPPLPGYVASLTKLGVIGSSPATLPYESSACLLMALQRGVAGAGIDPSQLTSGGAAGNLTLPGGSLPYLTDSWSRPIFFSRFPAGNFYLNPPTGAANTNPPLSMPWVTATGIPVTCYSQQGINDPGDPQGYLQTPTWGTSPLGVAFSNLTLQVLATGNTSYKLAPLLASGGPQNWQKIGTTPFEPITFYSPPNSGAMFSSPQQ